MKRHILVLGAGRSAPALIQYLLEISNTHNLQVTIADEDLSLANNRAAGHPSSRAVSFNVNNDEQRRKEISSADIVISLLPPHLHIKAAADCIEYKKHFLTASYLSPEMAAFNKIAVDAGILILNECGLDPGIDHMSAMDIINRLKNEGCELLSFTSYTGGLVAPESNNNPWGYKFSWNPKNVILAGQGTARYIRNSEYKYIPYPRIFTDIDIIHIPRLGAFDGYANRDSLSYRHHYGIENIPTLLRGTLRYPGYCRAWDIFVKLGFTDDTYILEHSDELTYAQIVRSLLPDSLKNKGLEEAVAHLCDLPVEGEAMTKIRWTGIFEDIPTGKANASPAAILQHLLEQKWKLEPGDKDMIVMQHMFVYNKEGKKNTLGASLVVKGENLQMTAMAKTVGLPLGITAKLLIEQSLRLTGVHIPVHREIYEPVLKELKNYGIAFEETSH